MVICNDEAEGLHKSGLGLGIPEMHVLSTFFI